jgi:hypothetical protein
MGGCLRREELDRRVADWAELLHWIARRVGWKKDVARKEGGRGKREGNLKEK